ncbi:prolyl oligopeptidase family serine peptidase [Clostridium tertium]
MLKKKMIGLICSLITSILLFPSISVFASESKSVTGTYDIVVEGFDWGPGVTKAIVTLDKQVSNVTKDMFNVKEIKNWFQGIQSFDRTVINAYTSDDEGSRVEIPSKYITIELSVNPNEGSPFLYNFQSGFNTWSDPYSLNITLAEGSELKVGEDTVSELNITNEYINRQTPTIDKFKEEIYNAEGDISMKYSYYEPDTNTDKKPLIIWLHGAGEGGSDTTINTLGNEVGALIESNIQSQFGGAYVLAPQSPTMWMDIGGSNYTSDGSTIYLESLMNLIKNYVNMNKDIDTNRIYIGGCSNGGFMTMALILENPEYFAAAYPICEAFSDSWITEDKLNGIKDLPIWFTYSINDPVVDPLGTSVATINRLKNINAKDVKVSQFNNVVDTSGLYKDEEGNLYEYNGHWSWIYAFNDECKDGEENLWSWLAKQEKNSIVDEPTDNHNDDNNTTQEPDNDDSTDNSSGDTTNKLEDDKNIVKDNLNTINKVDKLPNTGDILSSKFFILIGLISTIVGIKMKFNK